MTGDKDEKEDCPRMSVHSGASPPNCFRGMGGDDQSGADKIALTQYGLCAAYSQKRGNCQIPCGIFWPMGGASRKQSAAHWLRPLGKNGTTNWGQVFYLQATKIKIEQGNDAKVLPILSRHNDDYYQQNCASEAILIGQKKVRRLARCKAIVHTVSDCVWFFLWHQNGGGFYCQELFCLWPTFGGFPSNKAFINIAVCFRQISAALSELHWL